MRNQVQLITYVDRLTGGGLRELTALLSGPLKDVFGGVHLLPFFHPIDGSDAGFDPIDHTLVDPRLGDWTDVKALSEKAEIMADLIVNHVSSKSPQFQDFREKGSASAYAGLFLTHDRVFPDGAREADLLRIYRPRPGLPFTVTQFPNGEAHLLWTTFTPQQIDIDVADAQGREYLASILGRFASSGIKIIRLDAAGYAIKKQGTSCFMIPETFAFISELAAQARALGIEVLVEIHSYHVKQVEIAKHVDRVYDFALPPLILHALYKADAKPLKRWLGMSPRNAVTVLDTHDGIGVIDVGADSADPKNLPGLLAPAEIDELVETMHARTGGDSRKATGAAASNLDLYQVNTTYYDALGKRDKEYLIARAIQFWAPGVPQVYYVGALGGTNDMELLARSGVGRDINRHYYSQDEVTKTLKTPMVKALIELIRFRNTSAVFNGEFEQMPVADHELALVWRNGTEVARLDVDLRKMSAKITHGASGATQTQEIQL